MIAALNCWQSRKIQIHSVFNDLQDLLNTLNHFQQTEINKELATGPKSAYEKLQKYMKEEKQPASSLLREIRSLDPTQLPALNISYATIKASLH